MRGLISGLQRTARATRSTTTSTRSSTTAQRKASRLGRSELSLAAEFLSISAIKCLRIAASLWPASAISSISDADGHQYQPVASHETYNTLCTESDYGQEKNDSDTGAKDSPFARVVVDQSH